MIYHSFHFQQTCQPYIECWCTVVYRVSPGETSLWWDNFINNVVVPKERYRKLCDVQISPDQPKHKITSTCGGTYSKYEYSCGVAMGEDSAANVFVLPLIDLFSFINV